MKDTQNNNLPDTQISFFGAIASSTNYFIGVGMLSIPYTLRTSGKFHNSTFLSLDFNLLNELITASFHISESFLNNCT
jgi:hypothetical protein